MLICVLGVGVIKKNETKILEIELSLEIDVRIPWKFKGLIS